MSERAWPTTAGELSRVQEELARADGEPWEPPAALLVGAAFVCFERGRTGVGAAGDRAWAGAAITRGSELVARVTLEGEAGEAFRPGWLALREGPLLEAVLRLLEVRADVVLVDGTGRDHPRRAGLAVHLGHVLGVPTIGVTRRALVARASSPPQAAGAASPLVLGAEVVGHVLRPVEGARPIVVHAGWRTTPETALATVRQCLFGTRTPEPLRRAREAARQARSFALT